MNATKRAQVPFGLRKKLMAATSMLLVAAIMLVSTSYAWFTLSTAPEITGITTSVGANGNLEIALLTTETFANPDLITSNTGDSMAAEGRTKAEANITWGNLIDLTDENGTVYGMNKVTLYPAQLARDKDDTTKLGAAPLGTPVYGADGRVDEVLANTISAIYDGSVFADSGEQTYGVRAVGTSSNVSARAITMKAAKSAYATKVNAISTPIRSAVASNIKPFLTLAAAGGAPDTYTYEQVDAMFEIATGVKTSLQNIVTAYANIAIATAAKDESVSNDDVAALEIAVTGKTSASELITALSLETTDTLYVTLNALANMQTDTQTTLDGLNGLLTRSGVTTSTTFGDAADKTVVSDAVTTLLGNGLPLEDASGNPVGSADALSKDALYLTGGVVNGVAEYSGTFHLVTQLGVAVYAGAADYNNSKKLNANALATFTAAGEGTGAANITDFYGYIIDFAFRTNAASSNLQLQTAAANRVYSDVTDPTMATQGAGSTVTFNYADSGLNGTQATNLLDAVRLVFFNPEDSTIYKTAKITNVAAGSTSATGEIYLIASETTAYELGKDAFVPATYTAKDTYNNTNTESYQATLTAAQYEALTEDVTTGSGVTDDLYVLGKNAYEVSEYTIKTGDALKYGDTVITTDQCTNYVTATISVATYETLKSKTTQTVSTTMAADKTAITELPQNTVKKMSVLVYMDGTNIDNSAVANAEYSGKLDLNLQFSSSAKLVPMENNALKNMEASNT